MKCLLLYQIYIGGDYDGEPMLADEPAAPKDPNWTLNPGGVIEPVCGSQFDAIDFIGQFILKPSF